MTILQKQPLLDEFKEVYSQEGDLNTIVYFPESQIGMVTINENWVIPSNTNENEFGVWGH